VITALFRRLFEEPGLLPAEWQEGLASVGEDKRSRRVADYIAGMTDTFALEEHRRLFDTTPDLR
jgi:dGTPase